MTIEQRNNAFVEFQGLIRFTVNRNRPLLSKLRMDADDMAQELAIHLLKAIEGYDETKGAKPSTYYISMLQYGVLAVNREQSRSCRVANLKAQSLVAINAEGEEMEIEIPYTEDFDTDLSIGEFIGSLSERERAVLDRRLEGIAITDKRQKGYMNLIKKKAARFCVAGGL